MSQTGTQRIDALAGQMSEHFQLPHEEFEVLGAINATLVYSGEHGIPDLEWGQIVGPEHTDAYTVSVNGTTFDARRGMTTAVYQEFIARTDAGVRHLRESRSGLKPTPWTYLTGDHDPSQDDGNAHVAYTYKGDLVQRKIPALGIGRLLEFRPAVRLPRTWL